MKFYASAIEIDLIVPAKLRNNTTYPYCTTNFPFPLTSHTDPQKGPTVGAVLKWNYQCETWELNFGYIPKGEKGLYRWINTKSVSVNRTQPLSFNIYYNPKNKRLVLAFNN